MDNRELTLTDLLADPMTLAVMAADRVDPAALEALLSSLPPSNDRCRPDATKRGGQPTIDTNRRTKAVRKPIVLKRPGWRAAGLAVLFGLGLISNPVQSAPASGGDTVQRLYDALLSTMKNGRTLGQSGRFTQLEPVILRTFDIPSMTRFSVGPSWSTLTDAQRQQVTESFGRYISAIYADRFDSYAGQKLQVIGEQPAVAGIMVRSQIVKANGEPVNVDYMMRRNGDSWLISDIYLDGAISEVATRRSEFAAILKSQGIDGLIAALNRKADILTATTAKAS